MSAFVLGPKKSGKTYRSRSLVHWEKTTDLTTSPFTGWKPIVPPVASVLGSSRSMPPQKLAEAGLACEKGKTSATRDLSGKYTRSVAERRHPGP